MLQPSDGQRRHIAQELMGVSESDVLNGTLRTFFDYYDMLTCPSHFREQVIDIETAALRSHEHLTDCFRRLKLEPTIRKIDFLSASFPDDQISTNEKEHAARVIVQAGFMTDCSSKDYLSERLQKEGFYRVKWETNQRFVDFMEQTFKSTTSQLEDRNKRFYKEAISHKKALKAWKLVKRCKIIIRPTDNISEHLFYDPEERSLKIFHHIAFLRAHLKLSKSRDLDLRWEDSLKLGTLPPRLLFETLVSFHDILFPITSLGEKRSRSLLKRLIRKQGFDEDGLWVEFVRPISSDLTFIYFGTRLAKLYEVVKRPPPTNAMISWFERHTSERNALTVAIAGLLLAALFGFLTVVISTFQAIVAWLAWKHPVLSAK